MRAHQSRSTVVFGVLLTAALWGCAGEAEYRQRSAPVIYGADGRQEYYEAADPAFAVLLAEATVALVEPEYIDVSNPDNIVPDTITCIGRISGILVHFQKHMAI